MNKDINIQEVVGQIRDLGRMFKALKYAEEMADILVNSKAYLDDWAKQVKDAKAELEKVNAKTAEYLNVQTESEKAVKANSDKIAAMLIEADRQKQALIKNGKNEADNMLSQAKAVVESLNKEIEKLTVEKTKILKDLSDAKAALENVKRDIAALKQSILTQFQVGGINGLIR